MAGSKDQYRGHESSMDMHHRAVLEAGVGAAASDEPAVTALAGTPEYAATTKHGTCYGKGYEEQDARFLMKVHQYGSGMGLTWRRSKESASYSDWTAATSRIAPLEPRSMGASCRSRSGTRSDSC